MRKTILLPLLLGLLALTGTPALNAAPSTQTSATYHGNKDSKKFHSPACRYYNCKACTVVFKTREAAIRSGYVPCKICNP